jgi:hypothetical protein
VSPPPQGSVDADANDGQTSPPPGTKRFAYSDDVLASMIDKVISAYDKNDDGYVEYAEYKVVKLEMERNKGKDTEPEPSAHG